INAVRVTPARPTPSAGDLASLLLGRVVSVGAFVRDFGTVPGLLAELMRATLREPPFHQGPKLIICDPALRNRVGHHAAVA
ncbi:hypothetical protein, partial [Mycobacterium tuberculosis]